MKYFNRIVLILTLTISTSCRLGKLREPSSTRAQDVDFLLPQVDFKLTGDLKFELIDPEKLSKTKVVFSSVSVNDVDAAKKIQIWQEQLEWLIESSPSGLPNFSSDSTSAIDHLRRLDRILHLLDRSEPEVNVKLQKKIEIITAFNNRFKARPRPNLYTNNLPIRLGKTKSVVEVSGAKEQPPNSFVGDLNPRDDLSGLLNSQCEFEQAITGDSLKIVTVCSNVHFQIYPDENAKVAVFNSYILRHFGYYVEPVQFRTSLKINYDRNLLLTLNNLSAAKKQTTATDTDLRSLAVNRNSNNRADAAIHLKNGEGLSPKEALKQLLPFCRESNSQCKTDASLINQQFEKEVEYIEFKNVGVQFFNPNHHSFGPWKFEDLGHSHLSDLHTLYFLGAFVGNWRIQSSDNQLLWSAKNFSVFHQIGGIDAGLGRGIPQSPLDLNSMHWTLFTSKVKAGQPTQYFFDGYHPIVDVDFPAEIPVDQARKIARRLAQVDEDQLTEWLAQSGFAAAEVLLAREKLVSIQKNMTEVFNLAKEFPKLSKRNIDKNLGYAPVGSAKSFELSDGRQIVVDNFGISLKNGYIKSAP